MDKQGGFDSIANYYDSLARLVFGKAMAKSQTHFLELIPDGSRVLVMGGGTGWWLGEFLLLRPRCTIQFVDSSAKMIAIARAKVNDDPRISFTCRTGESFHEPDGFDAVVTHYFIDLFPEKLVKEVLRGIAESVKAGGLWLVADFVERQWWHSVLLRIMYAFFRITARLDNQQLPKWEEGMMVAGAQLLDATQFYGGFICSAAYKVAKHQGSRLL